MQAIDPRWPARNDTLMIECCQQCNDGCYLSREARRESETDSMDAPNNLCAYVRLQPLGLGCHLGCDCQVKTAYRIAKDAGGWYPPTELWMISVNLQIARKILAETSRERSVEGLTDTTR